MRDRGSRSRRNPLQSPSRPPGRPVSHRRRLPEVSRPYDDITCASPTCAGPSGSSTVPLPGSLSLSAVSWQALARDPLGPQPSLGSSPAEPSPRGDRCTSLEAACSPAVSHRPSPSAIRAPCHRRFPPLPRRSSSREVSLRSRLVPPSAMGSLSTRLVHDLSAVRLRASRSPRAHAPGSLVPGQLHLLRSLDPSVESVRTQTGFPALRGRCSPGVRPSRAFLRPGPGPYLTPVSPPVGRTC